ncbi:MAG: ATP synthase F1 subunit gamma [Candidatus Margulisiibacteriota bacterium]
MAQTREIKNRIESVKKTKKITRAMKMVAAAKFKKAVDQATHARPYAEALEELLAKAVSGLKPEDFPTLMKPNGSSVHAVIVIAGDRGLCGGFNTNVLKFSNQFLAQQNEGIELHLFGVKTVQFFRNKPYTVADSKTFFTENVSLEAIRPILASFVDRFLNGEIGQLSLCFSEFHSALSSKPTAKTLLPITPKVGEKSPYNTIFEPSVEVVLGWAIQEYLGCAINKAFLDSKAAEEGARMAAMESATDNAESMIRELTLLYNRNRQAQITSELSEIVAGAEALVQ